MPELDTLQKEFQSSSPDRVKIIGIGIDSPSNIRQFAAKSPVSYPLLLGGTTGNELARLFGNEKGLLPYTVIIGQDGSMMKTIVGKVPAMRLLTEQPSQQQLTRSPVLRLKSGCLQTQ